MVHMGENPWNRSHRPHRRQRARDPPAKRNQTLKYLRCRKVSMSRSRLAPTRFTSDVSTKGPWMTGSWQSGKFSDNRKPEISPCHIVVDTPVRSKTDKSSPRPPLTRSRSRSWRGKPTTEIPPFPPLGSCAFLSNPPRICLPARSLCPSRFDPSAASPCNALSRTTRGHFTAKGPCGTCRVPAGDSLVICP